MWQALTGQRLIYLLDRRAFYLNFLHLFPLPLSFTSFLPSCVPFVARDDFLCGFDRGKSCLLWEVPSIAISKMLKNWNWNREHGSSFYFITSLCLTVLNWSSAIVNTIRTDIVGIESNHVDHWTVNYVNDCHKEAVVSLMSMEWVRILFWSWFSPNYFFLLFSSFSELRSVGIVLCLYTITGIRTWGVRLILPYKHRFMYRPFGYCGQLLSSTKGIRSWTKYLRFLPRTGWMKAKSGRWRSHLQIPKSKSTFCCSLHPTHFLPIHCWLPAVSRNRERDSISN